MERELEHAAVEPAVAVPDVAPGIGPVGAVARVLALQRSAGNAAVSRMLLRQPAATTPANPLQEDYEKARKERDEFVAAGKKGPTTYNPSTGNKDNYYGGFDVEYDPAAGQLTATLKGAVMFLAGMSLAANGRAQAIEPSAQTAAAAAAINKLPKAARAAEVAKWSWSSAGGPDATDEADFLAAFKSSIEAGWRKKHPFHCSKQYWEDLGAETDIKVEVNKVAAAGDKGASQHMLVNAHKVVKGFVGGAADVSRPGGAGGNVYGNVMNVTSEDVVPRKDGLLQSNLKFQPGKGLLTPGSVGTVWRLSKEMPNAAAGSTIAAASVSVKVQGKDDQQRKDRFDAVKDHLKLAAGFDPSRATMVDGGTGDTGQIVVGTGDAQTVAAHEAGHMFGLDDEYTGEGAYKAGQKTEHTDIAAKEGHTGAMHAKSDSIMSEGKEVRPHHYVTFLDALRTVTGMQEWDQGPPRPVTAPSGAGDFPVPAAPGDGGTAVG